MKLSDQQTTQLAHIAATLPLGWRDGFLLGVAPKLDGKVM